MSKFKFWYVSIVRVSEREYFSFGIKKLADLGFSVHIVDISEIEWNSSDGISSIITPENVERSICHTVNDYEELMHNVDENDIIVFNGNAKVKLHKLAMNNSNLVGIQLMGAQPASTIEKKSILDRISGKSIKSIAAQLFKVWTYRRPKYNYDFVQSGGIKAKDNYLGVGAKTDIIQGQSFDGFSAFHQVTENKDNSTPYILLIDQCLPFHSDNEKMGYNIESKADGYFARLEAFLVRVENKFGLRVLISPHPRMKDHLAYKKYIGKRAIFDKTTNQLVHDCAWCLTHYSTALNYAVIYNKPVIMLDDEILIDRERWMLKSYAHALGCEIISTEEKFDKNHTISISKDKYRMLYQDYINSIDSIDKDNIDVLLEYVQSKRR
ncbi:hypothetical protein [Vibrio methylphosphonaticus]|uniref:hypothetical protein n=1 Tax=Vibrio methylphosphonaticus TaxID=2946866 RepID=UPI00202AA1DF|nr:hypothetical protein [Vibrio methylphosphonaticus]MCL9775539.1 hypothetical protein [Vibrio methylphosphonaticus]